MRHSARITLSVVARLKPGDTVWDTEMKGFGVRYRSQAISYIFKKRIKGRQSWITIGRHGSPWTPETARREALNLATDIANGGDPAGERRIERNTPNFAAVAELFLAEHGTKIRPSTLEEYRKLVHRYLIPTFGKHPIDAITHGMVASAHAKWVQYPRAANHALAVLSRLMTWSEDRALRPVDTNPCRRVKKYRENKRQRYLTVEEIGRLGAAIDQARAENLIGMYSAYAIQLLLLTGARLSEILSLKWSFVDLQRAILILPDSKTGQKTIALSLATCDLVRTIPRSEDNPYVICGHRHGAHLVDLHKPWTIVCGIAGLVDVRVHDLRHTFASVAVAQGGSLPIIGKMLGHHEPQTTARYAHLADDPVQRLTQTTSSIIAEAMKAKPERAA